MSYVCLFSGLPSSNTQLSGGFTHSNHNDVNGVKFISLAAPIQNDVRGLCTASRDMRMDSSKSMGKEDQYQIIGECGRGISIEKNTTVFFVREQSEEAKAILQINHHVASIGKSADYSEGKCQLLTRGRS